MGHVAQVLMCLLQRQQFVIGDSGGLQLVPESLGLLGGSRNRPPFFFHVLRRVSGFSFRQAGLSGHDLLAKFFCALQGEILMPNCVNRSALAFGVIGCHIVAGEAVLLSLLIFADPEHYAVLAPLSRLPVLAQELDFFPFAHRVVSPFQFFRIRCPPAGACLCVGG